MLIIFISCIMSVFPPCLHAHRVGAWCRGKLEKGARILTLDLWKDVSHYVGSRYLIRSFTSTSKASTTGFGTICPAPVLAILIHKNSCSPCSSKRTVNKHLGGTLWNCLRNTRSGRSQTVSDIKSSEFLIWTCIASN